MAVDVFVNNDVVGHHTEPTDPRILFTILPFPESAMSELVSNTIHDSIVSKYETYEKYLDDLIKPIGQLVFDFFTYTSLDSIRSFLFGRSGHCPRVGRNWMERAGRYIEA